MSNNININNNNNIILTHIRPDADAFASAIMAAMVYNGMVFLKAADAASMPAVIKIALEIIDNDYKAACQDRPGRLVTEGDPAFSDAVEGGPSYWNIVTVDCGDRSRIQGWANFPAEVAPIRASYDHHCNEKISEDDRGDATYPSASCVLWDEEADRFEGVDLRAFATLAMAGLIGDTMGLTRISALTLRFAAELANVLDGTAVVQRLLDAYRAVPWSRAALKGRFMSNATLVDGIAVTYLSADDFKAAGAAPVDYAGMPGELLDSPEVQASAALNGRLAAEEGVYRIAFRSRKPGVAQKAAQACGGNGHPTAAGGSLPTSLSPSEACAEAARLLREAMDVTP